MAQLKDIMTTLQTEEVGNVELLAKKKNGDVVKVDGNDVAKASLVENIDNGDPTEDETVVIEDDSGNEVAKVDEKGLHAKGYFVGDIEMAVAVGEEVVEEAVVVEDEVGNEVAKVDEKGLHAKGYFVGDIEMAGVGGEEAVEEAVVVEDEAGNEVAKVDEKGLHAKGYFDNNGNPAIPRKIYVAPSGANFTSLTRAILAAVEVEGTEVYVGNGTYDIINEYTERYGANFFDNFNEEPGGNVGIKLYNGIKVYFAPRAFVVCHYTGNNNKVMYEFSPFNGNPMQRKNDFEIHGLKIKASRVRYVVHDEMWSEAEPYTHKYYDCDLYLDNTNSIPVPETPNWHFASCIGGGLGKFGKIYIDGCKFSSEDYNDGQNIGNTVSYHNSAASGAQSIVDVTGCYFAGKSTFRFSWYGSSTEMSTAYVRGCRLGSPLINEAEQHATIVNAEIISWNNQEM